MTDLAAATLVQALDYPAAASDGDTAAIGNITSTSYIAHTGVTCEFIAPTTGRVMVAVAGEMRDNSSTNYVRLSVSIVDDRNGEQVVGPDAYSRGVSSIGLTSDMETRSHSFLVQGLEPGVSYTATAMYRVEGGSSADLDSVGLIVWPAT